MVVAGGTNDCGHGGGGSDEVDMHCCGIVVGGVNACTIDVALGGGSAPVVAAASSL